MIAISTHTDLKGLNAALQQPALCATWIVVFNIAAAFLLLVIACCYVLVVCAVYVWRVAVVVTEMVMHGVLLKIGKYASCMANLMVVLDIVLPSQVHLLFT